MPSSMDKFKLNKFSINGLEQLTINVLENNTNNILQNIENVTTNIYDKINKKINNVDVLIQHKNLFTKMRIFHH